jgi:HEAT repeat protein
MAKKGPEKKGASKADADALVRGMGQVDGFALRKLREAAEQMGAAAVGPMQGALAGSPRREVRWEAAKALGHLADPRSIAGLVEALDDNDADVARVAAEALVSFREKALTPLLKALVRNPGSSGIREGVRHVLRSRKGLLSKDAYTGLLKALEHGATLEQSAVAAHRVLMGGRP